MTNLTEQYIRYYEAEFPHLKAEGYQLTSDTDEPYNCIAWAADESERWWWPDDDLVAYWPPTVPRVTTLLAFELAYSAIGYFICDSAELEIGFQKIVIYADSQGVPTHAARQLTNGRWASKLGKGHDIEHFSVKALYSSKYGEVALVMKRQL